LLDLITIYDDEESLEVSLVTPVQIIEEKGPEKASTMGLDAPSQIHPQNKHEVESALDVEPLHILGTPMDSLRDDLGSSEREEIPQQEINISIVDYQASTEPASDSSVLASILPPDEQQLEAEPSGHTEEVQEPDLEQIYIIDVKILCNCKEYSYPLLWIKIKYNYY
jgi:hypothetical protein